MTQEDTRILLAAHRSLHDGLCYARDCLAYHDSHNGRDNPSNHRRAVEMEMDIKLMEDALRGLAPFIPANAYDESASDKIDRHDEED